MTWREVLIALESLSSEQLDMEVIVYNDGDFMRAYKLETPKESDWGVDFLESENHPYLRFSEFSLPMKENCDGRAFPGLVE